MAQHVKNMDRKQNFAKYGNSMTFWEFLVLTFQGQTNIVNGDDIPKLFP
jgi:hypothetical protein